VLINDQSWLREADRLKFSTMLPIVVKVVAVVLFTAFVLLLKAETYGGKFLVKLNSGPILTPRP
jgi:hypothetical protein